MSKVQFSADTIAKLKKFQTINQSIKIIAGTDTIRSVNESKTVAVETKIGEKLPRMLCVYDLREFLTILSIIKEPVIDFADPKFMLIQSADGSQQLRYLDAAENIVNSSYMPALPQIPKFEIEATVSEDNLKSVMNAATSLGLEFVGFTADGTHMYLKAFDRNNGDGNQTNAFSINLGACADTFSMFYKTDAWKVLEGECLFKISKNRISQVSTGDMQFMMTLDANSKYN